MDFLAHSHCPKFPFYDSQSRSRLNWHEAFYLTTFSSSQGLFLNKFQPAAAGRRASLVCLLDETKDQSPD